ncbi:hypothetical protein HETIRDRAFT_246015, partial [Heterobasidion irregulare TC 32-1]
QILEFFFIKLALFWLQIEVVVAQDLENLVQDLDVFRHVFGKDEDVVHIYGYFPGRDELSEDHVHHGLEVGKAEEHHRGFVRAQRSDESCLPLVALLD